MPSKELPWAIRYPDYGVPFKVISYGSYAQILIYYADFKKGPFSYEDHMTLRSKEIRKDSWVSSAKKLVGLQWLKQLDDGKYVITPLGSQAVRRIGNRNAIRRANLKETKDA